VKLAAIRDALDRAGLGAKTEVEITAKPYEQLLVSLGAAATRPLAEHPVMRRPNTPK
jgi:hypothetical protein